jgi:hypothetical protein
MTEQAVDALASFEPMIEMLLSYADLTVADDGIGKVEEAHKAVKRLRVDLDKKRKELNEGALSYQRTVNATAKTLTEKIGAVESRLSAERENYDAEKLREKLVKEAAKAAVLNERVARLSGAGIVVSDLAALGAMANDEFEFYLAKEYRIVAEAKAEAELHQKIAIRTARMEALGVACPSPEQIGTLSDVQFEHDYKIAKQLIDRSNAALKAEQEAEAKRQAEELRVRAEEIERQRLADEAVMVEERARLKAEREAAEVKQAEEQKELDRQRKIDEAEWKREREAIEADRGEMRRQQEEIAKHQAELRAKAEAEAVEERRKQRDAEQTRREAAAAPELEKLEVVLMAMKNAGSQALSDCGVPRWSGEIAEHFEIFAKVARQTVLESL